VTPASSGVTENHYTPTNDNIPVLFVTATAEDLPGDCRYEGLLAKPFHLDELLAAVRALLARAPGPASPPATPPGHPPACR
jgi:DNA-binding response OmpR family regulator